MPRGQLLAWWLALATAAIGSGALVAGAAWGAYVAVLSGVALVTLAWTRNPEGASLAQLPPALLGAGLFGAVLATLGGLPVPTPPSARHALVATGFQFLLGAAGFRMQGRSSLARRAFDALGHATIALGSSLVLVGGNADVALTCHVAGFAIVLLTAFWSQQERGGAGVEWEALFLVALAVGLAARALASAFALPVALWQGALLLSGFLALAVLARPAAPRPVAAPRAALVAHGLAAIAIVNVLLFAYTLVSGWATQALLAAFFLWLGIAVVADYRSAWRALRAPIEPAPEADVAPDEVTVVVAAASEAGILRSSLEHNLRVALPLRFLVVVSSDASDGTLALARRVAAAHPGRVDVVEADGGSKAGDLNAVWTRVETPYIVLLDADETIDASFVRRGVAAMRAEPDVAIVQGRKVPRVDRTLLSRLVAAERRYATVVDQPMLSEHGAAHFAGSAAMLRWGAVFDVDGWTSRTLTEDIELTLRLRLGTRWRIRYEPTMVARESPPHTWGALLAQRTRWARGWAQATGLYLAPVARSRLPLHTRASLGWQLLTAVSAPWSALLPVLTLVRVAGLSIIVPAGVALALAFVVLPSRALAFAVAAWRDPAREPEPSWLDALAAAYFWIVFGWLVQFHSLYLELSEAPHDWNVTRKRPAGGASGRAS